MGVRGWKKTARDTDAQKMIPKEVRVLQGPQSQWRKKKNWGHSAVKKILQKYAWSASTATGQTRAQAICYKIKKLNEIKNKSKKRKKERKKKGGKKRSKIPKFSQFIISVMSYCMIGEKQVISNFKSQYTQESHILSKHAVHIKLCLLNPMHIKQS
jgi:hypothetical protein